MIFHRKTLDAADSPFANAAHPLASSVRLDFTRMPLPALVGHRGFCDSRIYLGLEVLRVTSMVEKPNLEDAPSNLAIIGSYILTPDIFDIIKKTPPGKGGEIQITDALMQQAQNG